MNKLSVLFLIFIIFVSADKALTMLNLQAAMKIDPNNYLSAEKNPLARWFFEKTGLLWGTILYGIISVATLFFAFYSLKLIMKEDLALWIIFLIYGAVISGNVFWVLKNTKII